MSTIEVSAAQVAGCRASLPHNVVSRTFVAETVLLDVNSGRYFRLDRTAGEMLEALMAAPTVAAAAEALSQRGWGTSEVLVVDLAALCAELGLLGLVRLDPA